MKRRHFNALLAFALGLGATSSLHAQATGSVTPGILIVGDSLSAEYGLQRGSGWVGVVEEQLKAGKHAESTINAAISGDTTSGGRSRLPALLSQHKPSIVVLELGANDALRGMPLASTKSNLSAMVKMSQKAGAKVVLVGMEVPPNYGSRYTKDFRELFAAVAKEEKSALVPFLLAGVADHPEALTLFQSDRIHPNEAAQATLAANVWPVLSKLLQKR